MRWQLCTHRMQVSSIKTVKRASLWKEPFQRWQQRSETIRASSCSKWIKMFLTLLKLSPNSARVKTGHACLFKAVIVLPGYRQMKLRRPKSTLNMMEIWPKRWKSTRIKIVTTWQQHDGQHMAQSKWLPLVMGYPRPKPSRTASSNSKDSGIVPWSEQATNR